MSRIICIGSRESRLAVIQPRQVADYIRRTMPEADVRLKMCIRDSPVGLHTRLPLCGILPPEFTPGRVQREKIEIGYCAQYADSLLLIPRSIYLGIGCRRGTGAAEIAGAVESALSAGGLPRCALAGAASIDLKMGESGLLEWARGEQLSLSFYSAETLQTAPGCFSGSEFVKTVTGVDNVCELSLIHI